jgi:hypothetical protein
MSSIVPVVKIGQKGTTITCLITKPDPAISWETYLKNGATQRVPVPLEFATALEIEFEKPRGVRIIKSATIKNPPGVDGKIVFVDLDGIFDVKGVWKARGIATFSATQKFLGSWTPITVGE